MSFSNTETLVRMANQVMMFFRVQGEKRAVPAIAEHLMKFWEPSMREAILAHVDAGGAGLDPLTLKGIEKMRVDLAAKKKAAAAKPAPVPGPKVVA